MSDFFDDQSNVTKDIEESLNATDDEVVEETASDEVEQVAEKIKVGDEEYTQEELNRLVGLGKIGVEAEEKYNTKIDKVWPEFSKSRNEVKDLQEKVEALEKGNTAPIMEGDDAQVSEALEAAKRLGLMTKDQFDELYAQRRAAEKLLDQTSGLEKEYNGADGRPKFDQKEVLQFMAENGINDPELAYKVRYEKELDEWKEKRLTGAKKSNIVTSTNAGATSKAPEQVKPNRDNIQALIEESLGQ